MAAVTMKRWSSRSLQQFTILGFMRADFGLFRDLLGRVTWDKALEGRGAQKAGWYARITSSKLRSHIPQQRGSQAKTPGGLNEQVLNWTKSNTKKKPTEGGSKDR